MRAAFQVPASRRSCGRPWARSPPPTTRTSRRSTRPVVCR